MSPRVLIVAGFVALVGIVGMGGLSFGIGQHDDARLILEHSVPAILAGSYLPSRAFGVPLFEFAAAILDARGGFLAVQCYCLVLTMLAVVVFDRLLGAALDSKRRSLALAGFALHPLILIDATTVFEWSQMVLLILCVLVAATRWLGDGTRIALACYAIFSALLVLTRPDAAFFCIGLFLAMLWQSGFRRAATLALIAANGLAAAVVLTVFASLNHGLFGLLSRTGDILLYTSLPQRIAVALLRLPLLVGLVGVVGTVILYLRSAWRAHAPSTIAFWDRLLLIAAPILILRFMMLPDKLEYALPLLVVVLLALAHTRPNRWLLASVAFPIVAMSFVTVSLFDRVDGRLRVSARLEPGAVIQDWRASRDAMLIRDPAFLDAVARQVYRDNADPIPTLHAEDFANGLISNAGDLVVGRAELYRLDNPAFPIDKFHRSTYRRIYICDRSLNSVAGGWRSLQPPPELPRFDGQTGQTDLTCTVESPVAGTKP